MESAKGPDSVRLIVAVPPEWFFGGNDRHNANELLETLRSIYANVFVFDVGIYIGEDPGRSDALVAAAKAFRANVAIALPNASYALIPNPRLRQQKLQERRAPVQRMWHWLQHHPDNVFTDILKVPTILLWDHIITQAAHHVFGTLPTVRRDGQFGALKQLRMALANPRYLHVVPDSGHIDALLELDLLGSTRVEKYVVPAHAGFLRTDDASSPPNTTSLLFAGNLYGDTRRAFDPADQPLLAELEDEIWEGKRDQWSASSWRLLRDATTAREHEYPEISPDNTFFWTLANKLVSGNLTTNFRQQVLGGTPLPVDYFGGFADPDHAQTYGGEGHIRHRGSVPFSELPDLYRSYRVSVDVTNCPFIHGSNAKVLDCFAAGGFMLVDWRQDLFLELGDITSCFMYRKHEDLAALCDKVMTDDRFRREVISEMKATIAAKLNFGRLFKDTIERALSASAQ
jgi:hypothetical protein